MIGLMANIISIKYIVCINLRDPYERVRSNNVDLVLLVSIYWHREFSERFAILK